jgi:predicted nucleic acid-binding protein
MGTLIDSSVFIALERRTRPIRDIVGKQAGEFFFMSAITASELLHGIHRAASTDQRVRREVFVERLLGTIPVIPFDLVVARSHARLWAELAAKGTSIGQHDLIIAATAIAYGHKVASLDQRSFPRIPGLQMETW